MGAVKDALPFVQAQPSPGSCITSVVMGHKYLSGIGEAIGGRAGNGPLESSKKKGGRHFSTSHPMSGLGAAFGG